MVVANFIVGYITMEEHLHLMAFVVVNLVLVVRWIVMHIGIQKVPIVNVYRSNKY